MFYSQIKITKDLIQINNVFSVGRLDFLFPMKSHEKWNSKYICVHRGPS